MCTAISYKTQSHYFGRNLDLEYRYDEKIVITPRDFTFKYRKNKPSTFGYAMIGMATVSEGYPLYYEATNEYGLSMAGLNFPGNAVYQQVKDSRTNVASFELIPWLLRQCKNVPQAKLILQDVNVVDIPFSKEFGTTPLHWMLSDKDESIVLEPLDEGLRIYDNIVGVLTNNPPFPYQMYHLSNYINLTNEEPENRFSNKIQIMPYSRGMGAMGLPGDLSSASRFIKAAYTKLNSVCDGSETDSISQFFHILSSVAQQKGCVKIHDAFEKTIYSSCCNTDKGIYYYTTYENSQITAIHLFHEDLNTDKLYVFTFNTKPCIRHEN